MKMTNKSPLDRVKDARRHHKKSCDYCFTKAEWNANMYGTPNAKTIQFALAYLEASINDVHSEDEPTSFDMLQEFMEGKREPR